MSTKYIYLSPPNITKTELTQVRKVMDSGWLAPVGPAIDEFEEKLQDKFQGKRVLSLNSGTSALHLALILAGVEDGDEVLVSSFTFAACANVVLYERAIPVFIDSDNRSWNLDPEILEKYLSTARKLPKALIITHLYGMPADIQRIVSIAHEYGVKVIEDAAESLGSAYEGKSVGDFGDFGILSFNGNKIITTSGGGALICNQKEWERGKHLATQANSGVFGYDHQEAGYNYRMSNILAGIGLAQLPKLESFIDKKRAIYQRYQDQLSQYFDFLNEPDGSFSNRWLTTVLVKMDGASMDDLISFLDKSGIESRRLWKPLHLHSAYDSSTFVGTGICEKIFEKGICLPSGSGLTNDQQQYVIDQLKSWFAQ
ncbi:DegT/DnrJ/EryC1/StrS family aminotransferase [Ekhidna sp. To15]|uniref:DegT/DnrJ/EryC1/StrS family aminotransferase n=1 Tax=Ekhidna sp. To15 TaxID=3395267 RepID=UPI003F5209B3